MHQLHLVQVLMQLQNVACKLLIICLNVFHLTTFLDYGCGTGILGIASKKVFKKSKVIFVDIDENAVKLSKKNIKLNHIKVNGVYLTNSFFEYKIY